MVPFVPAKPHKYQRWVISFYLKSVYKGNNEKLNKFKYTSIIPIQEIVVYKNEIIERRIQTCWV